MSDNAVGPAATVVILTWNAGPEFHGILSRVETQRVDRPFEILAIDSGSTDGTVEILRAQGPHVRLFVIPHQEFNHGRTRNLGVREARGDIVVLLSQDACPADDAWLQRLIDCYSDPEVAGAYSRQTLRPDVNPFTRDRVKGYSAVAEDAPRVQSIDGREELDSLTPGERRARITFDNVSSSIRRSVAMAIPFAECRFGEDVEWAHRALLAGHRIVYEPRSLVVHSHNRSLWYELRRSYLLHQHLQRLIALYAVPSIGDLLRRTAGWTYRFILVVRRDPRLNVGARLRWWIKVPVYAFTQCLAQYLGIHSVAKLAAGSRFYRLCDRVLARDV